ncbi:hypothetical protein [Rosistilla oblonga]|uniref:hypothetical protein n=1 Tax=Rosistilla oblonga TaxID=2527990 RepID=UPI003A970C44
MDRKANAIEVSIDSDDEIRIQWNGTQSEDTFVCFTAAQAEQVCKWIMDAAYEIELRKAKS